MSYRIGVGKYDITGPCMGLGFLGMSKSSQKGMGIHTRLYSRAFVVEDPASEKTVAVVCADLGMCTTAVKQAVVRKLKQSGPPFDPAKGPVFRDENLMITATHTHSGPGGISYYHIYNFSQGGFSQQNFGCIVDGIYRSVMAAYENRQEGEIRIKSKNIQECGKIRSVEPYMQNPEILDAPPADTSNVEPLENAMTLLKFVDSRGKTLGVINWFALHPTNMGENNKLVSGDNKGYAEQLFEKSQGSQDFVAAFANSCCGDISPNAGKDENGHKFPFPDGTRDVEQTALFAAKQAREAQELFTNAGEILEGTVDFRHTYVDFSDCRIDDQRKTWPAAFGFGMLRGSEEDSKGLGKLFPGEGVTIEDENPTLETIKGAAKLFAKLMGLGWKGHLDNPDYILGHGSKNIVLPVGLMNQKGLPIAPSIMPLQMIKLGSLLLVAHPGELTVVAGMRLRKTVKENLDRDLGIEHIVVAAYANGNCSYTTTHEEYGKQNYEGASTLFGPWTLQAFQKENGRLAGVLSSGERMLNDIGPEIIPIEDIKMIKEDFDMPDTGYSGRPGDFGDFLLHPKGRYRQGDKLEVSILGGNLNRDLRLNEGYFRIEQRQKDGTWKKILTDSDFSTELRSYTRFNAAIVRLTWNIGRNQEAGRYKFVFSIPVKRKRTGGLEYPPVWKEFDIVERT